MSSTPATVIVVGSVNADLVIQTPRLPGPGETVIGGAFSMAQGGKGANQAVAAARLGARTVLIGATGADDFGQAARASLRDEGVNIDHLAVVPRPTGVASIIVDAQGENLIAVASGANDAVTSQHVTAALAAVLSPGAVVLANLEIPDPAVLAAAQIARERGCHFILNPAPARRLAPELLRYCTALTPNEHEVKQLGAASAVALLGAGVGAIVVTRGGAGADLLRLDQPAHHQDAFPVTVVDTTGAGDAFSATLAWALATGHELEQAVRLAAAAGALATCRLGARAGFARRAEVEALIASAST